MNNNRVPKLPFATDLTTEDLIQCLIDDTQNGFIVWKTDTSFANAYAPAYCLEGRTKKLYLIPYLNEFALQYISNNGKSVLVAREQRNSRNDPLQTLYVLIEKLNIEC